MAGSAKKTRSEIELLHILGYPLKALKETWARVRDKRDMFAVVDMATHWAVVTPLYSGLEQALKALAAHDQGWDLGEATKRGKPLCTHHLGCCWNLLGEESQATLEKHWRQFLSLHGYLRGEEATGSAERFLQHLSGDDGRGYERWRYSLIEMVEIPKVSVEGMFQLWESTLEVYGAAVRTSEQPARGPLEWVNIHLKPAWDTSMWQASTEIQEEENRTASGEEVEEHARSHLRWLRSRRCLANVAEEMLWHRARGLEIPEEPRLEVTKRMLEHFGRAVEGVLKETKDTNLRLWGRNAVHGGITIARNEESGEPECRLNTRLAETVAEGNPPTKSTVIEREDRSAEVAETIRANMYQTGYEVREHLLSNTGAEGRYELKYRGVKEDQHEVTVIEVWVQPGQFLGKTAVRISGRVEEACAAWIKLWLTYFDRTEEGEVLGSRIQARYGNDEEGTSPDEGRQGDNRMLAGSHESHGNAGQICRSGTTK